MSSFHIPILVYSSSSDRMTSNQQQRTLMRRCRRAAGWRWWSVTALHLSASRHFAELTLTQPMIVRCDIRYGYDHRGRDDGSDKRCLATPWDFPCNSSCHIVLDIRFCHTHTHCSLSADGQTRTVSQSWIMNDRVNFTRDVHFEYCLLIDAATVYRRRWWWCKEMMHVLMLRDARYHKVTKVVSRDLLIKLYRSISRHATLALSFVQTVVSNHRLACDSVLFKLRLIYSQLLSLTILSHSCSLTWLLDKIKLF